jgi:flavorubredoxin
MITEIANGVYWIGVTDWGLRHFHGHEFSTLHGSTYNSYLIMDEKIALVDTVWGPFKEQFMENVRELVDPSKIDIVVTNHAEPDHSGGLPLLMKEATNAAMLVSKRGLESVPGHYHQDWNLKAVSTGDKISLGENELVFIEAAMLHWPDTMFTYLTGRNILMSNDAFGQHFASDFRFNDQVDQDVLYAEALKYYANILTPFSKMVTKKIDEVLALNLPVDVIAPSHGVIWRNDPLQIVRKYQEWARQVPEKRAVIIYDSMWNATQKMAEAIADGLAEAGVPHRLCHMAVTDRNDVVTEIFKAKAVIAGSSTVNNGLLPTMTPILEDLKGMKFQNKIGAAFGSYGWSGECVKDLELRLTDAGIALAAPGIRVKWQPSDEDLANCVNLGKSVAEAIKAD